MKWLLPLLLATCTAFAADKDSTRLIVASDGQGNVRVFWGVPPDGGSVRLETEDGSVLVDQATPLGGRASKEEGALAVLTAMGDWRQARALGLGGEIRGLPLRRTVFIARRLDTGKAIRSLPVDLGVATPPPPPPRDLTAEATPDGVKLYWQPQASPIPVLAWHIERDDGRDRARLFDKPKITGSRWPAGQPAQVDHPEVNEVEVVYQVRGVDILGRESTPASVRVFVPDFSALSPPRGLQARSAQASVRLAWQANASRHTRAYLVERAHQTSGPWEVLTPRGVMEPRFDDPDARPGSTVFYRLRAVGPRGDYGEPSLPLPVNVRGEPPAPVRGLAAEVGHSRVRLTWQAVAGAAGYQVERRAGDARAWSRLTISPTPETRYDDIYGGSPGGRFEYRVHAVAPDEQKGEPGPSLSVALPDTVPPPPPHVTATSGEDGRVRLAFKPAMPAGDTVSVLVLRGASAEDPGVVIGDPIPVRQGEFLDTWVDAGKTYVYRLVALDAAGNRGDPGAAVRVRVGAPPLGVPERPRARYLKEPFPRVELAFTPPPRGLHVVAEAGDGRDWRVVAGPVSGGEAIDLAPGRGASRYRLRYQSASGALGESSPEVDVHIP